MELSAQYSKNRQTRIMFNVSDSSLEEMSTSTNDNSTSIKRFNVEIKKHRIDINSELTNLTKEMNLAIWIIYGLYSFTWYQIGVQWLGEPHWGLELNCNIPGLEDAGWSFYEKRNLSSPPSAIYESGCIYYDYPYYNVANLTYEGAVEALKILSSEIINCKNVTIEVDVPKEVTHIREFEVYCLRRAFRVTKFYVHVGVLLFGFPTGLLADIYGRRLVNNVCTIVFCISAFVESFSPNFIVFAMATCLLGGSLYSINMLLGIIYSEIFRSRYRGFNTMLAFGWFYVGCAHLSSHYHYVEVWRLRKLIIALSTLILVFGAIMIVPESPRLLSAKRQFKDAWDALHQLGCPNKSNVQNYLVAKMDIKYQLKLFSKSYLLHRMYAVMLLNGVATFFYYLFKHMKRSILKPSDLLTMEMLVIEIILVVLTALLMFFYSRKALICIFYVLLSLSIITNMLAYDHAIMDVSALAGREFSAIIYMLTIIYLMEVFPTSHRATSMGLYLTTNHMLQSLSKVYIDELVAQDISEFFATFYCGICMLCALISVMIPDSDDDIPDRKEDLFLPLPISNTNLDVVNE